jgi:hypothetical protein
VVKMESEEVRVREVNSGTPGRGRIPHRGHTNAEETTSEKSEAAKVDAKAYVSAIEKRQGRFCPSRPRLVLNSSRAGHNRTASPGTCNSLATTDPKTPSRTQRTQRQPKGFGSNVPASRAKLPPSMKMESISRLTVIHYFQSKFKSFDIRELK